MSTGTDGEMIAQSNANTSRYRYIFRLDSAQDLDQLPDQPRTAGLVARAEASGDIAVEVLVKRCVLTRD